jgi:hypothetical protein
MRITILTALHEQLTIAKENNNGILLNRETVPELLDIVDHIIKSHENKESE